MLLALAVLTLIALVLVVPPLVRGARSSRSRRQAVRARRAQRAGLDVTDPGRERRAEQRARELLRSCVNDEEWAMYRDLGFIRVHGRLRARASEAEAGALDHDGDVAERDTPANGEPMPAGAPARGSGDAPYAYLIYPHKPIVAFLPATARLLSEYCVEFPDLTGAISSSRLPDSDDVLAKWMALTGDERRLIRNANMHLPGRQIDPGRVRRDLWRLSEWERQRGDSETLEHRRA